MAKKKAINTFEGGIDQDTDKKLVKPNTLYSASNITISKNGFLGSISSLKGFQEIKASGGTSVNLNDKDLDLYKITVDSTISSSSTLFEDDSIAVINTSIVNNIRDLYKELLSNYS